MFIIESKFGNDGYATWFKILEVLAKTDNHWIDMSDTSNVMYMAAKCRVSEDRFVDIVTAIASVGEFDADLWNHERVIWSDKFLESVADAYVKRSNNAPSKSGLLLLLRGLGRCKPPKFNLEGDVKPQSKVDNSKEKEIKVEHPLVRFINEDAPTVSSMKQPLTNEQAEKLLIDLQINTKERRDELKRLIMAMENYVPLKSKSKSANLTIRKWWSNEQRQGKPNDPANETQQEREAREFMEQLKKDTTNLILYGDVQPNNHDQQPANDSRVQRLSSGSTGHEAD
jgi:hypothetical protein